ncbi:hypothetical protein UPYG_G00309730 [Umbra pygmaea]|uniref:Uncharacterized protein n=1 Tax=Umbra pygmaea TaxID=75934 RepID=A0ABD0W3M4_UMBPY
MFKEYEQLVEEEILLDLAEWAVISQASDTLRKLQTTEQRGSNDIAKIQNMSRLFYFCFLTTAILVHLSHCEDLKGAVETHYTSAGYFFQLNCGDDDDNVDPTNVTWKQGGNQTLNTTAGLEVRGKILWFLPALISHSGSYTCELRNHEARWNIEFVLTVDPGCCPVPAETRSVSQGTSQVVFCRQRHVLRLDPTARIQWFKDCRHEENSNENDDLKRLWLTNSTDSIAGVYTCIIDFSLHGRRYKSARSTRLKVNQEKVLLNPQVTNPRKKVIIVEPGSRVEVVCSAFLGVGEGTKAESSMFWTVDGKHTENIEELTVANTELYEHRGGVYGWSNLSISEVHPKFLNVPFLCIAINSLGKDTGVIFLQPADHSVFYTCISLCLAFSVVVIGAVMWYLFKVDLVLAYRKLRPLVSKKRAPDGKLYDAYVSYLDGDGSSRAETFALQVLPEVLEKQYGYSLFISGRDDLPGEAILDLTSETMRRSRRLIVVLSAQTASPLNPTTDTEEYIALQKRPQICANYDHQIGLYDALIQNGLRVVLVETDAKVDYISLPESLRYIRRKQGALRWKLNPGKSSSTLPPNRHFWKCLRYYMPPETDVALEPQPRTWDKL